MPLPLTEYYRDDGGKKYEGQWRNGERHGWGGAYDRDGNTSGVQRWRRGEPVD